MLCMLIYIQITDLMKKSDKYNLIFQIRMVQISLNSLWLKPNFKHQWEVFPSRPTSRVALLPEPVRSVVSGDKGCGSVTFQPNTKRLWFYDHLQYHESPVELGLYGNQPKKNMVHHSLSSISISKECHKIWVAYFQTSHARAFGRVTVPAPIAFAGGGPGQLCEGSCRHSFGKVKNLEVIAVFQYVSICVNVFHI